MAKRRRCQGSTWKACTCRWTYRRGTLIFLVMSLLLAGHIQCQQCLPSKLSKLLNITSQCVTGGPLAGSFRLVLGSVHIGNFFGNEPAPSFCSSRINNRCEEQQLCRLQNLGCAGVPSGPAERIFLRVMRPRQHLVGLGRGSQWKLMAEAKKVLYCTVVGQGQHCPSVHTSGYPMSTKEVLWSDDSSHPA